MIIKCFPSRKNLMLVEISCVWKDQVFGEISWQFLHPATFVAACSKTFWFGNRTRTAHLCLWTCKIMGAHKQSPDLIADSESAVFAAMAWIEITQSYLMLCGVQRFGDPNCVFARNMACSCCYSYNLCNLIFVICAWPTSHDCFKLSVFFGLTICHNDSAASTF